MYKEGIKSVLFYEMSLLSNIRFEIIEATWRRYSGSDLNGKVLFFTSSVGAANKYKDVCMKWSDDILKFQISGKLKLVNVARYIEDKSWDFEYNIIDENNERKDSTPESAEQEGKFYADLIQYAGSDIAGIDGFYTPQSKFHHEEMVLLNNNIIESLINFEPYHTSFGTPQKNPAQRLQIENRQVFVEKRNIKSVKRRKLNF